LITGLSSGGYRHGWLGICPDVSVFVTRFLPGWVVPTALVAHSDEAMLALTWIVMCISFLTTLHLAYSLLIPQFLAGKCPWNATAEDHPLEYDRLAGVEEKVPESPLR